MPKKQYNKEGIGGWSEIKLECIKKYLGAYSNILHYAGYKEYYFIDAFAGEGICKVKKTGANIKGSTLISLSIKPPFTKYFFIELNKEKIKELENIVNKSFANNEVIIKKGDCNTEINSVLDEISEFTPFVALLDPQAGDLYWETVQKISVKKKAEVLINFPFGMAINRYMPFLNGGGITQEVKIKLNKIFGNNKWEAIYQERKNNNLNSREARIKYLDLYLDGLINLGYKYYAVKNLKNSKNAHLYYLIFATKNRKGLEKIKDSFVKNEQKRNSLFFEQELEQKIYKIFKDVGVIDIDIILEKLLSGTHIYKIQDFKEALKKLENENKLVRIEPRKNAKSFNKNDLFKII